MKQMKQTKQTKQLFPSLLIFSAIIANGLSGCAIQPSNLIDTPQPHVYTQQELNDDIELRRIGAPGLNACGFKVFNQLLSRSPGENVAFSPTSLGRTFLMVYVGAGGSTRELLANFLGMPDQSEETLNQWAITSRPSLDQKGVSVKVSDSVWVRSDFSPLPAYINNLQNRFYAEVGSFKDASDGTSKIGAWITRASQGLIDGQGFKVDDGDVLALTDVLTFDGRWNSVFDAKFTEPKTFDVSATESTQVQMMRQTNDFHYAEKDGYQIVRLPYDQSAYAMYILMAKDLASASAVIDEAKLEDLLGSVHEECHGEIQLPRFTLDCRNELAEVMQAVGLEQAFSDSADFSGIAPNIKLSNASQKVRIAVDETGTVAAAATMLTCSPSCVPPPFQMEVNHPFYFAIREDKTKAVLFIGKVVKPES